MIGEEAGLTTLSNGLVTSDIRLFATENCDDRNIAVRVPQGGWSQPYRL